MPTYTVDDPETGEKWRVTAPSPEAAEIEAGRRQHYKRERERTGNVHQTTSTTGTEVWVLDLTHPVVAAQGLGDPAEGGRWLALCAEHGGICQFDRQDDARYYSGRTEEWCPTCQEKQP